MHGSRAVALALLICLGTLAGVSIGATQQGPGPSMSVQTAENTSNYFGPDPGNFDRSGQKTTSLDVAAAVSANAGEVRTTFSIVSIERKYDDANSPEERRAVVRNGTDRLADRVAALERQERAAIERYARGETGETDLFRTLASVDAEATGRISTAEWLQGRAAELEMGATLARLTPLRIRLVPLRGPVREDITDGLDGQAETRVHVETPGDGLVLATIRRQDNGDYVYVREAYSPAIREVRGSDRYGARPSRAFDRLQESYPWVNEDSRDLAVPSSTQIPETGTNRLYSFDYSHDHGRLTPYLDGGSGQVIREIQAKDVDRVPTESRDVASEEGDLLVRVERTRPGGPLGVTALDNATASDNTTASDNATGQRVNATVSVDGEPVGFTRNERLWTIEPRGDAEVTVSHEGDTVTVAPRS